MHEDYVHSQSMQPSGKRGLAAESCNLAIELEKSFLGEILGLSRIAGHTKTEGVNTSFVKAVESFEACTVACLGAIDSFSF
jgi:hypothetical protein